MPNIGFRWDKAGETDVETLTYRGTEVGEVRPIWRAIWPEYYWVACENAPLGIALKLADEPLPTKEQAKKELIAYVEPLIQRFEEEG